MKKLPLYRRIFDDLYKKIDGGELLPGDKLPSEPLLAEKYNVSRVTVARALDELKDMNLITRTKKAGTFVKSPSGDGKFLTIPVILPYNDQDNSLLGGIHAEAEKNNCIIPYYNTYTDKKKERNVLSCLLEGNVDGIIVNPASVHSNLDLFAEFEAKGIPLVFIDYALESINAPLVTCANMNGMYSMVKKCIELGHRDIAFFAAGDMMLSTERERLKGYYNALIDNSIPINHEYVFTLKAHPNREAIASNTQNSAASLLEDCISCVTEFKAMKKRPTVICCNSDIHAIILMNTLRNHGISVPDDVSITGFDNIYLCDSAAPPLTSVSQNFDLIGKTALITVLNMIRKKDYCFQNIIPTDIIMRSSLLKLNK